MRSHDEDSTRPSEQAFTPEYLELLDQRDEPATGAEADTAGPWSLAPHPRGHAVLRAGESLRPWLPRLVRRRAHRPSGALRREPHRRPERRRRACTLALPSRLAARRRRSARTPPCRAAGGCSCAGWVRRIAWGRYRRSRRTGRWRLPWVGGWGAGEVRWRVLFGYSVLRSARQYQAPATCDFLRLLFC